MVGKTTENNVLGYATLKKGDMDQGGEANGTGYLLDEKAERTKSLRGKK